jgi:hypothetical protein
MTLPQSAKIRLANACCVYFETRNRAPMRRAVIGQSGELAQAVREILKGGRHQGPCRLDLYISGEPEPVCSVHVQTFRKREAKLLELTEKILGIKYS